MENPYKNALDNLFDRILSLRYNAFRLSNHLKHSITAMQDNDRDDFISGSALIISDISSNTDNGWTINFHTGHVKSTLAKGYREETIKLISIECCYAFAQVFEALEGFVKDILHLYASSHPDFWELIKGDRFTHNDRNKFPGGEQLFKFLKKATKSNFTTVSNTNNYNLRFSEFLCVISQVRHAVVHTRSIVAKAVVFKSSTHRDIFNHFFYHNELDLEKIEVILDYKRLDTLTKSIAEFAFQIYKMLSSKDGYHWKIDVNKI